MQRKVVLAKELAKALAKAEKQLAEDTRRLLPSREEQWRRISALAGLDVNGNILPPDPKGRAPW